ncbi:MAG: membrane dipeptidase [Caldithrix sp.]|nr:membrane dipeptidase [Caldithrix sp.]
MRHFLLLMIVFSIMSCTNEKNDAEVTVDDKAAAIHRKVLTLDSHTDTPLALVRSDFDPGIRHEAAGGGGRVDFPRMQEGGLDAVFFAAFIGQGPRDNASNKAAKEKVLKILKHIHRAVAEYPQMAGIALTSADAYQMEKTGKRAIYMGIENGFAIGNDLSLIQTYYDLGVRYITLCHTRNNDICDSSTDPSGPEHQGVSSFGKDVIREMNRLGIMVDVSHISDAAFFQVLQQSATPVIASHSCARALCDHPRNLSDAMLKALAENNGVIQVCLMSDYLKTIQQHPEREAALKNIKATYGSYSSMTPEEIRQVRKLRREIDRKYPKMLATVSDLVDHIDHIVKVAGIDHVGIGSDFDGGGRIEGCMDVSEMGNITRELVKRGYTEEAIRKIWAGNLMRVFKDVEQFAASK